MSWKKNAFSHLLWLVYTVLTGFAMVGVGSAFCADHNYPSYFGAAFAVILAAFLGGAAFLLRFLAGRLRAFFEPRKGVGMAAETTLAVVLLVAGLILRIAGLQDAEENSVYYDLAEVRLGQNLPPMPHVAAYVYVQLLHVFFVLMGNRFILGILFQFVLQCAAALLLFFRVRKSVGPIAALVVLGFFACAPFMVQAGLVLSPEMMYLCLFAAAMSAAAAGQGERLALAPFIFAGAVSAMMSYIDVAGALLFLFSLSLVFCVRREQSGPGRKAAAALCCVLGFFVCFAGFILMDAQVSGNPAVIVLRAWTLLYQPEPFSLSAVSGILNLRGELPALLALMTLGVFSYWFDRRRERLSVCMLSAGAVFLAMAFGIFTAEMPGVVYLYLLLALMAGVGLEQCLTAGARVEAGAPQKRACAGLGEIAAEEKKTEKNAAEEDGMEEDKTAKNRTEENVKEGEAVDEKKNTETSSQPAASGALPGQPDEAPHKEIQYLENPLPLPKKHEKKVLDYDYPVADDDDFDI